MNSLIVIETVHKDYIEWGLSFDGFNPSAENYFELANKETAFRLKEFIENSKNSRKDLKEYLGIT